MPQKVKADDLIPEGDSILDRLRRRREKMDEGDPEGAREEFVSPPRKKPERDENMDYMGGLHRNRRGFTRD